MLSVLMSTYYKENPEYLNQALASIFDQQTYQPDEIILVEDGPLTAEIYRVIQEWKSRLGPLFKVISLDKNVGTGQAKDIGLSHCVGDFIAIMDTDDIAQAERFARQLAFLQAHPEIDAVGTWICEIDENGQLIKEKVEYPLDSESLRDFFAKRDPIAHPTTMFRRSFFEKAGSYSSDLHLAEDTLLWYKGFLNGCKIANIDYIGLAFRRNSQFYQRRADWKKTVGLLKFRLFHINPQLGYGLKANLFAIAYFLMSISPSFVKRLLYQVFR